VDNVACKWLSYAERDVKRAKVMLRENDPGASTFFSQQAAEKALKAILVSHGINPPRTHSIEYLLDMVRGLGVNVSGLEEAEILTDYAVESRYPDFGEEPSEEEAERALTIAEMVVSFAKDYLARRGLKC